MPFWQSHGSNTVQAWNNAVGFEQLEENDLELNTFEEWISVQPGAHLTRTNEYETSVYDFFLFLIETDGQTDVISVARNTIYTSISIDDVQNLQDYKILDGYKVSYDVINLSEFCESFQHATIRPTQHLLHCLNHTMFFIIKKSVNVVNISIPGANGCFLFSLNLKFRESHLSSLLYETKHSECYGIPIKRTGTWFLKFVDAVNECTNMRTCELTDESTLAGFSAACSYSLNHHGLSWYMSHSFLIDLQKGDKSIANRVSATNAYLKEAVEYWNSRRSVGESDVARFLRYCPDFPMPTPHMIKFYNVNIQLRLPNTITDPAYFDLIPEEFTIFRSKDLIHVVECDTEFVVSDSFSSACRFRCETIGPEWLTETPLDPYRVNSYYRALFPMLQACHDRTRQPKRFREPDVVEGECHAIECLVQPKSKMGCLEFCESHFRESIEMLMTATRMVSVTNDVIELVAPVKRYFLRKGHVSSPTTPYTIFTDLMDGSPATLIALYEFELFIDNVDHVTGYLNNQQIDLGTDFEFVRPNRLTLYAALNHM